MSAVGDSTAHYTGSALRALQGHPSPLVQVALRSWTVLAFPRGLLLEHVRALCCTVGAEGGPAGPGFGARATPGLSPPPPADAVLGTSRPHSECSGQSLLPS